MEPTPILDMRSMESVTQPAPMPPTPMPRQTARDIPIKSRWISESEIPIPRQIQDQAQGIPIKSRWMSESEIPTPWYDIKPIVHRELNESERSEVSLALKMIRFQLAKQNYQYALDKASKYGLYNIVSDILESDILEMEDIDVNLGTALYLAAMNGHEHIVILLLQTDYHYRNNYDYISEPLTEDELLFAMRQAYNVGYTDISVMIQKYISDEEFEIDL